MEYALVARRQSRRNAHLLKTLCPKPRLGGFILLWREVLSRYAAAAVRRHPQELGCIRDDELLAGDLECQDFKHLPREDEAEMLRTLRGTTKHRYVVCQREGCEKALFLGRVTLRLGG